MQTPKTEYDVHKFGGTSITNAARFIELNSLLKGKNEVIVVSATQGTTSILQTLLDSAKKKLSYLPILEDLYLSHQEIIKTLRL